MQIKIIKPGMLSTIQDMGRALFLSQAVPNGGAMDTHSFRLANIVLGNEENAAAIEFTYANAAFEAITDILIAYAGFGSTFYCLGQKLPKNRAVFLPSGSVVYLEKSNSEEGCRTYLSIAGGFQCSSVMKSKSTYLAARFGGYHGRALQKYDLLTGEQQLNTANQKLLHLLAKSVLQFTPWEITTTQKGPQQENIIRVTPGREANWFTEGAGHDFYHHPYSISNKSNRMGYFLDGAPLLKNEDTELLSTAVTRGTIQVTGNGRMVLLMADSQTTGGYQRIAQVAAVDLPLCAQLTPNNIIFFKKITTTQAESLYIEQEKQLQFIRVSTQLKLFN